MMRSDVARARDIRRLVVSTTGLIVLLCPVAASAAPHCMAHLLKDVAAEEAPEEVKSKSNAQFGPITKIKVNRRTGRMSYCAGTSYCYGANAFEIVSACRVQRDDGANDPTFFVYTAR